jgi:hypothetical protein
MDWRLKPVALQSGRCPLAQHETHRFQDIDCADALSINLADRSEAGNENDDLAARIGRSTSFGAARCSLTSTRVPARLTSSIAAGPVVRAAICRRSERQSITMPKEVFIVAWRELASKG